MQEEHGNDIHQQLKDLRLKETYLEIINSFALILVDAQSIDEIVWGVTKNAIAKLNYEDCIIYIYDAGEDKLIQRAAYGPKNLKHQAIKDPIRITPGKGIVGDVFSAGVGEIVSDTSKDPRYIVDDDIRLSEITVPLICEGRVVGVIDSEHTDRDFFNAQDFELLTTVAALVSTKLEQAMANEKLQRYQQNLESLVAEKTAELKVANKFLSQQNKALETTTSELNEALQKEKHLSEIKSHFVSVTSHQFRTPLAIIQSNCELLKIVSSTNDKGLQEKLDIYTSRISQEIARLTELMDDVLILGKVSSKKMTVYKKMTDLSGLCLKIAEQFNELQTDGRRLDVQVKGKPRKVPLDISMLQHAVTNLISNAFKFSKERNPEMTIKYQESGASILIRDHGIGIPKEEISNLFQPFHRAKNATEISGSGLGLAIAKDYIELNEGTLKVESKLNQGTCFTIILPAN